MEKVEILAPAGDWMSLRTAIYNGANAVYLGMQNFNARAKATNFTTENIREVTRLAHLFGVKIYLTVNTLINNKELPDLVECIKSAVEAKVDAYIVQDFGVLALLNNLFPSITLHASTQMGVHNLYGAEMAEKMGVSRVVLSRETKLEDIIAIKKHTKLELEYFVQGALCVAFSGNCYFSSMEAGESGNRGRCLQLCRLPYTANMGVVAGQQKYLLSPADLCLLSNLKKLIEAGICCFKIEGRLRRAGYVGQAVSTYSRAIEILSEAPELDEDFIKTETYKLQKVFNRGEYNTEAYLNKGVPDKIINFNTQNHIGISIGKVLEVKPFKDKLKQVIVYSEKSLKQYDGLKFFEKGVEVGSLGVGNVDILGQNKYRIYTSQNIQPAWDIHLIADYETEKVFEDNVKFLPISIKVEAKTNQPLKIIASINLSNKHQQLNTTPIAQTETFNQTNNASNPTKKISGNTSATQTKNLSETNPSATEQTQKTVVAIYISDFVCEVAKNSPTTQAQIIEQVSKAGGTPFIVENVEVDSDNIFIPKSLLNEARRQCLQTLEENIIQENEKHIKAVYSEKNSAYILGNKITSCSAENCPYLFGEKQLSGNIEKYTLGDIKNDYLDNKTISHDINSKNTTIPYNKILVFNDLEQIKDFNSKAKEILFVYAPLNYEPEDITQKQNLFQNFGLNLPIIANGKDLKLLDSIIEKNPNIVLIANNIYGLHYSKTHTVLAGCGMNVYNNTTQEQLIKNGASACVLSFEQKPENITLTENTFIYTQGTPALMTFCHCPYKTVFQNDCSKCGFKKGLTYTNASGKIFPIRRTQVSQCYFELLSAKQIKQTGYPREYIDLR